jgi:cellulose biosynthesis protein BcsQ
MKVINLFAPPGAGKSTTAKLLSAMLSLADYKVEFLPEFAKFATLSRNHSALSDQIYMFAKQENRLKVLSHTDIDYVVMDGPLPLTLLWQPAGYYRYYEPLVMEVFSSFDNINFLLRRGDAAPYKTFGRNETEAEAADLGLRLEQLLERHKVPLQGPFEVSRALPARLFDLVLGRDAKSSAKPASPTPNLTAPT